MDCQDFVNKIIESSIGRQFRECMARTGTLRLFLAGTLLGALLAAPLSLAAESALYMQGKRAFGARNYDRAYELFQQAVRANPSSGNPHFYMGYILEQQGRRSQAIVQYQRGVALRMDPDLKEKAFWKIVLYYKNRRDWQNLLTYSERFLRFRNIGEVRQLRDMAEANRDPDIARLQDLMKQGEAQSKAGNLPAAEASYNQALDIRPDFDRARWELAQIQMKRNRYDLANRNFRILLTKEDNQENWVLHYQAGVCALNENDESQALTDFENARRLNDDPSDSFLYFINYAEGRIHINRSNWREADRLLEQALEQRRTGGALGARSLALWRLGRKAEADQLARASLKQDSDDRNALLVRTEALLDAGNRDEARRSAETLLGVLEASESGPEFPAEYARSLLFLGEHAAKQNQWELAVRSFARIKMRELLKIFEAQRAAESSENALRDYNFYYGVALLRTDRNERAITHLDRVENSSSAEFYLSVAHAAEGNSEAAARHLKIAATNDAKYWDRAKTEAALARLLQRDAAFARFVEYRGDPPEPEPGPQPQSKPEGEAATNATPTQPAGADEVQAPESKTPAPQTGETADGE